MGTLYENIMSLCESKGITGYRLCKDIGMTPSALTDLKMGRKQGLSAKNANKIADYFGVSVGFLLGDESENTPAVSDERPMTEIQKKTIELVKSWSDEQAATFYRIAKAISDEE